MLTPTSGERRSSTEVRGRVGQSRTASDQHQPASSRAMAVLATTVRLRRASKWTQRSCRRRLARWPRSRAAGVGGVLAAAQLGADPVGRAVVPGGLDQQPAGVPVAGLGDRPLASGRRRRRTRWAPARGRRRSSGRSTGASRRSRPRARTRSTSATPRRQPSRVTTGVNSLAAAISAIAASSRSRRAVVASTVS